MWCLVVLNENTWLFSPTQPFPLTRKKNSTFVGWGGGGDRELGFRATPRESGTISDLLRSDP